MENDARICDIKPVLDYVIMLRANCSFALNSYYGLSGSNPKVDNPEYRKLLNQLDVYNDLTRSLLELPVLPNR